MISNIDDNNNNNNNSSRYSLDISDRMSISFREGESRRREYIRNNIPHQMIQNLDEDDVVQLDEEQQEVDRQQLGQENVDQQTSLDYYKNQLMQKDSMNNTMTFNNRSRGIKYYTSNPCDNVSQVQSFLSDNANFDEINIAMSQKQWQGSQSKAESYQQPVSIDQSKGDIQYEEDENNKIPITSHCKLKITNYTQGNTTINNSQFNNNSNIQNSLRPSIDIAAIQLQSNSIKPLDAIIPFANSDQIIKLQSSRKFISDIGSRVIENNSTLLTPVIISPANRIIRKQTIKNPTKIIQAYQSTTAQNITNPQEQRKVSIFNLRFFKRTQYINRFIKNLKNKSATYIFRHINRTQFDFFADKTADFSYYQDKGILSEQVKLPQFISNLNINISKKENKKIIIVFQRFNY